MSDPVKVTAEQALVGLASTGDPRRSQMLYEIVRTELDRLRADKKSRALRQARLLLIVHNAIQGKQDQIAKQFGGNAPEDIQILLDDAHTLHATLDELRAENAKLRERVATLSYVPYKFPWPTSGAHPDCLHRNAKPGEVSGLSCPCPSCTPRGGP